MKQTQREIVFMLLATFICMVLLLGIIILLG